MKAVIEIEVEGEQAKHILAVLFANKRGLTPSVEVVPRAPEEAPNDIEIDVGPPIRTAVGEHVSITAAQKKEFVDERRAIVGKKITQTGFFKNALIEEHIKGTLYTVKMPSGELVDAKHKKQKTLGGNELGAGWSIWEVG